MLGLRWFGRAPPPEAAPAPPPGFDAVISVGPYNLPDGVAPGPAIVAIRQAVNALPGAAWISIEHHPEGSGTGAVQVTPTNHGPMDAEITARVEAAVARSLAVLALAIPRTAPLPIQARMPRSAITPPPERATPPSRLMALPAIPPTRFPLPLARPEAAGFAEPPARVLDALAELDALASLVSSVANPTSDPYAAPQAGPESAPDPGPDLATTQTDIDLLATLIGRVLPDKAAAYQAAAHAVVTHGSYAAVLAQPGTVLLALPGLGPHSVAAIKLVHEAALRLARATVMDRPALTSFEALIHYLTAVLAREPLEHVRVLFLDTAGRIRADEAQARGTVNHAPVYPRDVARRALELAAASVILVHNHPSGDPSPSDEDLVTTCSVQDACGTVGIEVQDHIIVGNARWFSFREQGLLAARP